MTLLNTLDESLFAIHHLANIQHRLSIIENQVSSIENRASKYELRIVAVFTPKSIPKAERIERLRIDQDYKESVSCGSDAGKPQYLNNVF